MNDALYIAATGMQAHQTSVDTIANNLVNINTPGFKMSRVSFQDMIYRELAPPSLNGDVGANSLRHGAGVAVAALSKLFIAGDMRKTDAPLDIAIQGDGFLEVNMPDGSAAFSRGGSLQLNHDGFLATMEGNPLKPNIHIGTDAKEISIQADGRVLVRARDQGAMVEVGRIELANFANPSGLEASGQNLYKSSERSGDATFGRAGEEGMGTILQGYLEASNVKMVDEMVNLMVAQRAYEMSVKVIQVSDEMLGMSNNLRR
jgi:flagellar basal-body rod protein FlgG